MIGIWPSDIVYLEISWLPSTRDAMGKAAWLAIAWLQALSRMAGAEEMAAEARYKLLPSGNMPLR